MSYHGYPGLTTITACVLACSSCGVRSNGVELYREAVQAFRHGNLKQALELTREARKRCRPDTECNWSARLLEVKVLLSDNQRDPAAVMLSEEPPQASRFAALAARRILLQGDLQRDRGHPEPAEELYSRARQMATSARAFDVVSEVDLSHARLLSVSHKDAEGAARLFHDVAEQSARREEPYYEAVALNGLGMIRLGQWRFDEAIPWFQRTTEAASKGGIQRLVFVASSNLMLCYYSLGSFDDAVRSYLQAIDLLGESGPATYRMHLLTQMGNTLRFQDRVHEAIPYYRQAVSLAKADDDAARCYRILASAYTLTQDWDAARQSINSALSYVNDRDSEPWVEKIQAEIAAGLGQYDESCRLYRNAIALAKNIPEVSWESHSALAGIYSRTGDYPQADVEFAKTIKLIDNNVENISTPDYRLTFFSLQTRLYHDYIRALIARNAMQRALEVADSSRARLLLQRLKVNRKTEVTSAPDYQGIARRLNSVLLFYLIMPEQSFLWVVTPDGIQRPIPLPPAEQIRRWVKQYRDFIEGRVGDPMANPNEAGRQLYDALIAPAEPLIPHDSRVILVPDDALSWLNFETLPVYPHSAEKQAHYWIDDVRVEIAPSLRILSTEKPSRPQLPDSLLIIGDPVPPSREFPRLDYAAKEIATIEAKFPQTEKCEFTRSQARPDVYRTAEPGRFSLMHFSAHALANKESPLDSTIILSPDGDGENFKLYARNVIDTPLRAELVTISACRSAGARTYSGEGLVGFAWAFLQAGAHNVIAGLWDVTDSSTPDIMDVLYSKIAAGVSPSDALRAAKLSLIHSARGYRRPYYWGPFQVYIR
jgi:CHAT domain-containing protein